MRGSQALGLLTLLAFTRANPWHADVSAFHFPELFARDLGLKTFYHAIKQAQEAEFVLVDFYAPWCPHCQRFAPELERVALAASRAPVRGRVFVAVVDCEAGAAALCDYWQVKGYPTVKFGTRAAWLSGNTAEIQNVGGKPETAEAVSRWIAQQVGVNIDVSAVTRADVSGGLAARPSGAVSLAAAPVGHVGASSSWDVQLAIALFIHKALTDHALPEFATLEGPKKVLMDFISLAAERLPKESCRSSLTLLRRILDNDLSRFSRKPRGGLERLIARRQQTQAREIESKTQVAFVDTSRLEKEWRMCGADWIHYGKGWAQCRGTWPNTRGYTCGLWSAFHTLAARTTDASAAADLEVLRTAVDTFFDCEDCRSHFRSLRVNPEDTRTRRDVQLWWWRAHNLVNERVGGLEAQHGSGDPRYPKVQWPSAAECPRCRAPALARGGPLWDLDEVGDFLDRTYGFAAEL